MIQERLSDIRTGESVYLKDIKGNSAFRKRMQEMGFIKGTRITVIKNAPLKDPVEYNLMGYNVSLRRSQAGMIEVSRIVEEIPSSWMQTWLTARSI
jgi:ferrous iron transport protein B